MSQLQVETSALNGIPSYTQVPETSYDLDWADLATLDLSIFNDPGGKQALAAQLKNAIEQIGFFYIINFGVDQAEVDRQFAIGREFFNLDIEEKLKYRADLENGGYNGYKPLGIREIAPGYFDNTEIYNIPKFIPQYDRSHPSLIKDNWPAISKFGKYIHEEVVCKLLVLFAIILELPEDSFLKTHRYSEKSDCHLRYMKYHARTPEVNKAIKNVWVKGHTDFGSLTLLFRQPVAALQVRTPQETWKYVKPYPGSITVNIADSLSFLTNGYLKSSIHRVVAPPPDQAHLDRLGILYFVRPEDDLELKTVPSPLLKRLGLDKQADGPVLTAGEWVKARVAKNVTRAGDSTQENGEQEIIKGVSAKYYD
ncbi:hypothetical protein ONS95_010199 [Cadophora gregata]|uniref:uncharacterized protein n=1 Tax=Cadophora gregata TaxID=51156 RepID=UPI0026DDC85F|nr:uncharacterized protein ONS95_010199 [Cadophora gregata]KAK0121924.1 hypothetical protein ONS95_010199 [Cadophora gregata]